MLLTLCWHACTHLRITKKIPKYFKAHKVEKFQKYTGIQIKGHPEWIQCLVILASKMDACPTRNYIRCAFCRRNWFENDLLEICSAKRRSAFPLRNLWSAFPLRNSFTKFIFAQLSAFLRFTVETACTISSGIDSVHHPSTTRRPLRHCTTQQYHYGSQFKFDRISITSCTTKMRF